MATTLSTPRQVRLLKCALLSPGLYLRAKTEQDRDTLKNYGFDLSPFIQKIDLYESIFDNTISASLNLLENIGLPEYLPIVGVETIAIVFEIDTVSGPKRFSHSFRVVGIKDLAYPRHDFRMYTLILTTNEFVLSASKRICRVFRKSASDSVREVLSKDLGVTADDIDIEDSHGTLEVVIPNYTPLMAINYFSVAAQTVKTPRESNFLFYETLDGFHFNSLANIFQKAKDADQSTLKTFDVDSGKISSTPVVGEEDALNSILRLHQEQTFDLLHDIAGGTLRSKVVHFDFLARKVTDVDDSRYTDAFKQTTHLDAYPFYPENFDLTVSKDVRLFLVPTNVWSQESAYNKSKKGLTETEERLHQSVVARNRQLKEIKHMTTLLDLPGQPDLRAGDVVIVNYPSTRFLAGATDNTMNQVNQPLYSEPTPYFSGRHLVTSVHHILTTKSPGSMEYRMNIRVNRDSLSAPLIGTSNDTDIE